MDGNNNHGNGRWRALSRGARGGTPRMRAVAWAVVGLVSGWCAGAWPDERFDAFLEQNPPRPDLACSFTSTVTSAEHPGEVRVERYTNGVGWQLLTINDAPPTAKALRSYTKEADDRDQQRQQPGDLDLSSMFLSETAVVVEEDADSITFSFTPTSPEGGRASKLMERMDGRMTVAKEGLRPLRYVAELTGPASVMPGVKFEVFRQDMTFTADASTGAALMSSMTFDMRGKAFFRTIETDARIEITDYDCALRSPNT